MARKPAGRKTTAKKRTTERGTGASLKAPTMQYANFGAGSAAYLDPSDPNYAPTPATDTVLLRKGGYTKVDGKLYKGTYAGVNKTPYLTGAAPTPYLGYAGDKTKMFIGPGGISTAANRKQFEKDAKAYEAYAGAPTSGGLFKQGGGGKKGRGGKKGHDRALKQGGKGGTGGTGYLGAGAGDLAGFGGPESDAFVPYAEADTTTTAYRAAQGKAYGKGAGEGLLGQTSTPPAADSTVVEEAATGGGGRRKRHPGRKVTRRAKRKSSPGGRTVTKKERARIQKAKGK